MDLNKIIIDTYTDGYAVNSIKRILLDKHKISMSDEKIKQTLISNSIEIRPRSFKGKVYNNRPGRFAHIK